VFDAITRGNPAQPRIDSLLYDHTSVLKLIEWRWGLAPLTARDASNEVSNLATALDFTRHDSSLPDLPVIADPPAESCVIDEIFQTNETGAAAAVTSPAGTGARVLDRSKATSVARAKQGEDNEAYDFYLLQQSERMAGWTLPPNVHEK
jgi:hypothetical protein